MGFDREVLVRRREAVGAVLQRRPSQAPQGLLQPLCQGAERFPAQHHRDVAPAAVGEPEVVETVLKRLSGDRHRDVLELGEVRQTLPPRLLHLAEHDLLVRLRAPPSMP